MMKSSFEVKQFVAGVAVACALVFAGVSAAQAQESNIPQAPSDAQIQASGITFPVPELGNCGSKNECKAYCESPANAEACVAFAEKHGLMNKEEAAQAKKFTKALAAGGPGGCKTPQECESFCSNIANLEACMSFAKKQGIKNAQVSQGEKLLAHMKAGGKTPGGCTSEADCKNYCSDFSHAEECYEFAKKAGIVQTKGQARQGGPRGPGGPGGGEDLSPEQFEKVMELAKSGQTPGGCKSKDACEAYCGAPGHTEECVTFAEKAGFMSREEAAMVRKTGGKGPGGCSSPQACEQYCNEPANRETCFKFAEENGFISKEEVQRAKEGLVQLRAGIEHAPPEVAACLKSTLGPNVLDDIQAGKLTPGPEIGDRMRGCFEKFGSRGGPQDMFKNAPPEVAACIKEKIGGTFEAIKSGKEAPTPEMADTLRVCFQSVQFSAEGGPAFGGEQGEGGPRGPGVMRQGPPAQALQQFLRTAPPQVQECLKQKLGDNFAKLQSNEPVEGFDPSLIRNCFESFRPQEHFGPPGGEGGFPGGPGGPGEQGGFRGIPEDVLACVKEKSGGAVDIEKLRRGERPTPEVEKVMGECFGKMGSQGGQGGFPGGPGFGGPGEQGSKGGPFPQGGPQGQAFSAGGGSAFGGGQGGIPREILSCVKEKVGQDVTEEKLRASTGDQGNLGQAIRECFGKMQPPGQGGFPQGRPEGGFSQGQNSRSGPGGGQGGLPESVLSCVKEKAGDTVDVEKLRRGAQPTPDVEKVIGECFGKMNEKGGQFPQGGERGGFPGGQSGFASGTPGRFDGQQQFQEQYKQQFDEQFKQQYNQQYNAEFQKQYGEKLQSEVNRQTQGFQDQAGKPGYVNPFSSGPSGQGGFGGQPNQQFGPSSGGAGGGGQFGPPPGPQGGGFPGGGGFGPGPSQSFQPQEGRAEQLQPNQPLQPFAPQLQGPQGVPLSPTGGGAGGTMPPPPGDAGGGAPPPSGGQQSPPPPSGSGGGTPPPPPSSAAPRQSLLGTILSPFIELLGIGR
ncbi:MAG: hypothetical protein HYW65_00195 [Candidatus Liptonbacteria bacterium]|nr:hypothetical protein [Candidatus Liptonbacteria bacterium]